MSDDRVVAIGFLTRADLDVLGQGFTRCFKVRDDDVFADLLAQLDHVEPVRTADAQRETAEG